jgi:hypothetical protein
MPVSLQDQYQTALNAMTSGDIDRLERLLVDPSAATPEETRTVAERMGMHNGLSKFLVNTVTDPTVIFSFLMSKRFPARSWLTGEIPKRFVGAANEFTGISQYTRPIETYFRGTTVPKLVALAQYREHQVLNVGNQMIRELWERPNWKNEMPIVSLLAEGQSPAGATPELRAVADRLRGRMNEMWGFLKQTQKIEGGLMGDHIEAANVTQWAPHEAPRFLRDYLPHIPLTGEGSTVTVNGLDAIKSLAGGRAAQALRAAGADPNHVWTQNATGRLESDFVRYQAFINATRGQVYNERLFQRQRHGIPIYSGQGQELFVTDLNEVLQKYVHSVAKTYALNAPLTEYERTLASVRGEMGRDTPTSDPIIVQIINRGLETLGGQLVERPVVGTAKSQKVLIPNSGNPVMLRGLQDLVRAVSGRADEGEIMFGNLFSTIANRIGQYSSSLSRQEQAQIDHGLQTIRRNQQYRKISNGIASYFYSTTLGMNARSAMQNLLQPIITTGPALGLGPMLAGMSELRQRIPRYFQEFQVQRQAIRSVDELPWGLQPLHRVNQAAERAFALTFPELARSGIKVDPKLFDVDEASTAAFGPRAERAFKNYDVFAKFLMQPFTNAEMANQASSFFGARHAIKQAMRTGEYEIPRMVESGAPLTGEALENWINFESTNIVNATQFRPGPGSRSIWQGRLPAFARMFSSFPTRMLSFIGESTVRGAMTQAQLENASLLERATGGRNLGTIARMYLYGRVAQGFGRDVLGVDLSRATGITSAFSLDLDSDTMGVIPIPPAAGVVMDMVKATTTRDIREMHPMVLPGYGPIPIPKTLIPGGVGLSRAMRAMNQWRPDLGGFVDEDERMMYAGNAGDLTLSMLGVPLDKARRARDAMDRVSMLRDKVRQYRRKMAQAIVNGDSGGQQALQAQWAEDMKGWPPLNVSAKDVQRYRDQSRIPALQRMIQQLGTMRPMFEADIQEHDADLLVPQSPMLMAG